MLYFCDTCGPAYKTVCSLLLYTGTSTVLFVTDIYCTFECVLHFLNSWKNLNGKLPPLFNEIDDHNVQLFSKSIVFVRQGIPSSLHLFPPHIILTSVSSVHLAKIQNT